MSDKQQRLERLKSERKQLTLKHLEGTITQAEKNRLTTIRDEIRRLERQFMQRIA